MKRYDPTAERERLEKSIHDLTNRMLEIGLMLDDDSISDSEFSRLEKEEIEVIAKIGKYQTRADFLNVRSVSLVNDWAAEFLESFETGTRKISNRQGETFRKVNNGEPFIYKGRRYDCRGANYRAGFGTLIITDLGGTEIWPETETTETTETEKREENKMKKRNNDNFTGIEQLPSGFYAVFVSGVWVDAASANREQAEQKLKQFTNDRYKRPRARNREK